MFCYLGNAAQDVKISEHFLGFVPLLETTGLELTEVILQLQEMGIPIEDMRSQGYDNGSNMRGRHCKYLM